MTRKIVIDCGIEIISSLNRIWKLWEDNNTYKAKYYLEQLIMDLNQKPSKENKR